MGQEKLEICMCLSRAHAIYNTRVYLLYLFIVPTLPLPHPHNPKDT